MPKLPDYTSPTSLDGLRISNAGAAATAEAGNMEAQAARHIGQTVGNAIDEYSQSQLANDSVTAWEELTRSWQEKASNSDPNKIDQTADDWRNKDMEDILDKHFSSADTFIGGKDAEQAKDKLRYEFWKTTAADSMNISGQAVESSLTNNANRISATVGQSPEAFESGLNTWNSAVEAQIAAHHLTPEQAAKFRTEVRDKGAKQIAEAAFIGLAEKNPQAAQQALDAGHFAPYFTPEEAKSMQAYAQTQAKAQAEQIKQQNKDAADTASKQITSSMVQPDGSLRVGPDYFANIVKLSQMPGADPGTVRAMIDMGRSILETPNTVTDPHTYEDFARRVTLQQGDPNALTDQQVIRARADGRLSDKDYNFFKEAISKLSTDPAYKDATERFKTFLSDMKPIIAKTDMFGSILSPVDAQNWYNFQYDAQQAFDQAYKTGTWQQLIDPRSPTYFGNNIPKYTLDRKGAMGAIGNLTKGGVPLVRPPPKADAPARKPGESPADFLKRTSGGGAANLMKEETQEDRDRAAMMQKLPPEIRKGMEGDPAKAVQDAIKREQQRKDPNFKVLY